VRAVEWASEQRGWDAVDREDRRPAIGGPHAAALAGRRPRLEREGLGVVVVGWTGAQTDELPSRPQTGGLDVIGVAVVHVEGVSDQRPGGHKRARPAETGRDAAPD